VVVVKGDVVVAKAWQGAAVHSEKKMSMGRDKKHQQKKPRDQKFRDLKSVVTCIGTAKTSITASLLLDRLCSCITGSTYMMSTVWSQRG
jgi:hypothetical protein